MSTSPCTHPTLKRLLDHPVLSNEEESRLVRRMRAGDEGARHALVRHNLRLAWSFVQRRRGMPGVAGRVEEFFGEAVAGLYRAAKRYEPGRARFSSYATFYLRDAYGRHRRYAGFRSEGCGADRAKPDAVAWQWLERTGREAGDHEIARELGWSERRLRRVLCRAVPLSLEAPAGDSGMPLAAVLGDEALHPAAVLERDDLHSAVRRAVGQLPGELREAIVERFGLGVEPGQCRGRRAGKRIAEDKALAQLRRMLGEEVAALRHGGTGGAEAKQAAA